MIDFSFAAVKADRNLATGRLRGFTVVSGNQEFRKWLGGAVLAEVGWNVRCTSYSDSPWTAVEVAVKARLDQLTSGIV